MRWKHVRSRDPLARLRPWEVSSYYFNITEDWRVDDHDCEARKPPDDNFTLLCCPLPTDLPRINKYSLTLLPAWATFTATHAFEGRIGYRRKFALSVRGPYHRPFFGKVPIDSQSTQALVRKTMLGTTLGGSEKVRFIYVGALRY